MAQRVWVSGRGIPQVAGAPVFEGDRTALFDAFDALRASGKPELVITPNVDQVLDLETDASWREVFSSAALRVIDGTPLLWLIRAKGGKDVYKHSGADLLPEVAAVSAERGWRVAITGGTESVLAEGVKRLAAEHPDAVVVGVPFPMLSGIDDPASAAVISRLQDFSPDLVFVCLGAPKQEKWVHHWAESLPGAVYIGAGAAIDFVAGVKSRAPEIAQRSGLEWTWRVAQEPKRLAKRYFGKGPRFLLVVARSFSRTPQPGRRG